MIFLTIESDFRGIKVTKNGLIQNHKNEQFLVKFTAVSGLNSYVLINFDFLGLTKKMEFNPVTFHQMKYLELNLMVTHFQILAFPF